MSNKIINFGQVFWSREDMLEKLEEFAVLYEQRPIQNNLNGMRSPHLFMAWFALQALKPKVIIESGVWLGQGTWFFEQACPDAQLYCIDLNLDRIQYKSKNAQYFDQDFSSIDWSHLPQNETVLFFDDHQNAYERLKTARWFGFKHVIFEDNYPPSQGDCYSVKQVLNHATFSTFSENSRSLIQETKQLFIRKRRNHQISPVPANSVDAKYLKMNTEAYFEFPPIFKVELTRWNDPWDEKNYPTPKPLLDAVAQHYHQIYYDEAIYYTWMCYMKLNDYYANSLDLLERMYSSKDTLPEP